MARGFANSGRDGVWRAWIASLAALVFLLQGFGLFASAPRPTAPTDVFAAAQGKTAPGCFHHTRGDGHAHGAPDSCPMCQALGCSLPGAPPPVVARAATRVVLVVSPAAQNLPPRAHPLSTPPARGPPVLV